MAEEHKHQSPDKEDPPPLFENWSGWYALLIFNLLALIALFYIFTKIFE